MKRFIPIVILGMLMVAGTVTAVVHRVPGDYSTIQEALNACGDHDVVEVQPATYTESLTWPDAEAVTLRSSVPDTKVNIRAPGHHQSLLSKTSSTYRTVILQNLDFAGAVHAPGAGIRIENAMLVMRYCASRNHRFFGFEENLGLALYCVNCELIIDDCEFSGNEYEPPTPGSEAVGLAVYLEGCSGSIRRSVIRDNIFDYSSDIVHSPCDVDYYDNRFEDNRNYGSDNFRTCLAAGSDTVVISGNMFRNNRANHGALMTFGSVARVENNLFEANGYLPEAVTFKPGATFNIVQFNTFADSVAFSIGDPGLHSIVENNIIMTPMTGDWSQAHCLDYNLYGFEDPGSYPFEYGPFDVFGDPLFIAGPGGDFYLS
ncbi:MAG TPA: right-handed parallel beta-helix repeat-containing protein, partial [bacterium]|nr:right-handed parallel beta-helix repeat-containing protein [bacterium]